jgi:adenylate cyclase
LTEQAIALDLDYAAAYVTLCKIQSAEVILGVYKNPRQALEEAAKLGEKSITLDDSNALAHATLSVTYAWLKEHDKAISEAEKGVSLDPNCAYAYHALGNGLDFACRSQEAIPFLKKCLRLSPIPVDTVTLIRLANAYCHVGQYEEAVASCKKALQLYGADHLLAHLALATTYSMMSREKEAHAEAAEVMRIDPKFSLEAWAKRSPYKDPKKRDNFMSALRKAGLKRLKRSYNKFFLIRVNSHTNKTEIGHWPKEHPLEIWPIFLTYAGCACKLVIRVNQSRKPGVQIKSYWRAFRATSSMADGYIFINSYSLVPNPISSP